MPRIFDKMRKHLSQQDETYFEHMLNALLCSLKLIIAGSVCAVHAVFPFLFVNTASRIALNVANKRANPKILRG